MQQFSLGGSGKKGYTHFLIFSIILILILISSVVNAQTATAPSGSGTSGDPYQIANLENLYWVTQNSSSWSSYFIQTADIDASSSNTWDSGSGFTPIGNSATAFEGNYDGDGYSISSLFINRSINYVGLFGNIDGASITNLSAIDADVTGNNFSGILCGQCDKSTLTDNFTTGSINGNNSVGGVAGYVVGTGSTTQRIYSTATVTGSNKVGGLIGNFQSVLLSVSYATGDITGTTDVGGLLGYISNNSIEYSYATGDVSGSGNNIGGLIGNSNYGQLDNVYSTGTVTGGSVVGGSIGRLNFGILNSVFWDSESSGTIVGTGSNSSSYSPVGLTNSEMQIKTSFSGFNFNSQWEIEAFSFPYLQSLIPSELPGRDQFTLIPNGSGTSGDPYQIATLENLYWLSQSDSVWGETFYFEQTADIDASATSTWDDDSGFTPIGNNSVASFKGTYKGGGFTISNLFIDRPNTDIVGLFGKLNDAYISNLGVIDANVEGRDRTGILAGQASDVTRIDSSYTTGIVRGEDRVGGLLGSSQLGATQFDLLYSEATVIASASDVGGLIGFFSSSSGGNSLNRSYATGDVSGLVKVGGLVGFANRNGGGEIITNSYAIGSVTSSGSNSGGLVGQFGNGSLVNNYATGRVSGTNNVGALVGSSTSGSPITDNFWNEETSGLNTAVGNGSAGSSTILTTFQMLQQANYNGFDFNSTWAIQEYGSFPYLQDIVPDSLPGSDLVLMVLTKPSGSGTEIDPYQIETLENLAWLSKADSVWDDNAYFQQTADIDASETIAWEDSAGFSPIGATYTNFNGQYDGGDYSISNLSINRPSTTLIGLFGGVFNGSISNLSVYDADLIGDNDVGILAGKVSGNTTVTGINTSGLVQGDDYIGGVIGTAGSGSGSVSEVFSSATVTGNQEVGGIVGEISSFLIEKCYSTATVSGSLFTGGIAGASYYGTVGISNCHFNGSVSGSSFFTGGIIGRIIDNQIEKVYATGTISGSSDFGGVVGENEDGTLVDAYWNQEETGVNNAFGSSTNSISATGLTNAEALKRSNFDFDEEWSQFSGFSEPFLAAFPIDSVNGLAYSSYLPSGSGTEGDPYQISNLQNLQWISAIPSIWEGSVYFEQTADIDASPTEVWEDSAGFSPIGAGSTLFEGIYDGKNFTISGLHINRSSSDEIGLFAYIDGASLTNINLVDVDIQGNSNTGSLVGRSRGSSSITNSSATGTISGDDQTGGLIGKISDSAILDSLSTNVIVDGFRRVGGIIGEFSAMNISNCSSIGSVSGTSEIGGIAGTYESSDDNAIIDNCYSSAVITGTSSDMGGLVGSMLGSGDIIQYSYATGNVIGADLTGGLVGYASENNQSIRFTYATGNVSGDDETGGLVGYNEGTIQNSYSTGDVTATGEDVGGLAGYNEGTIQESYSTGNISGAAEVGAFVGDNSSSGIITNGYWNSETSGQVMGIGRNVNSQITTSLTSAQMKIQTNFIGFNFDTTWAMVNTVTEPFLQSIAPDSVFGLPLTNYPAGSGLENDPFEISSLDNLIWLSEFDSVWNKDAYFNLMADLDASSTSSLNDGAGFRSIGTSSTPFEGSVDGNDFTISNLFINRPDSSYSGLFGKVDSSQIQNIHLENVNITGREHVGALVGETNISSVNNVTVSGTVDAHAYVGGMIGSSEMDTLSNAHSTVSVMADSINSGGLIGYGFRLIMTDCSATGNVSGAQTAGGLIGFFIGPTGASNMINCSASGDVSGSYGVGGLIGGTQQSNIRNTHATGDVTASDNYSGGLIGFIENQGTVTRSFATGDVTSTSNFVGGLIGGVDNRVDISRSYAIGDVSTPGDYVGGLIGGMDTISGALNNYATGSVNGNQFVGGLIGGQANGSGVGFSFSTGKVSGNSSTGGFIGLNSGADVINGYWNSQTSQFNTAFGTNTNSQTATDLSIGEMTDSGNFSGFDFVTDTTWAIHQGFTFPYLIGLSDYRMVVAQIDSGEGWRMLGHPGDITYDEFLNPLFTQGFDGSDAGTGFDSNVFLFEEQNQSWNIPSSANDYFGTNQSTTENTSLSGILMYVYADDDGDGNSDGWPKYIVSPNTTLNDSFTVALSYTDNVGEDSTGWNLVSNPYPSSLDWTEVVSNDDNTNTFPVAYVWDNTLNDGNGSYQIIFGFPLPIGLPQDFISNAPIPAMQSFWVKATDAGASLDFKPEYQSNNAVLFEAPPGEPKQAEVSWLSLRLEHEDFSDQLTLFEANEQHIEAPKLNTIAFRYAEMSFDLEDENWAVASMTLQDDQTEFLYPIQLNTTETGTFELFWEGLDSFGEDWSFSLVDLESGATTELIDYGSYTFEITEAVHAHTRFQLRAQLGTSVSNEDRIGLPKEFSLAQNYPNPFNPSTNIGFALPENAEVRLEVFDMLGRKVVTLVDQRMQAGLHEVTFNARNLASGMYIYRLQAGNTIFTKKLMLIK